MQKALHPEGPGVCHSVIVHPPGGIVGGDRLHIRVKLSDSAHALITTPGATKWYRARDPGDPARQEICIHLAPGATLEWLPQESIVFDRAEAESETAIELEAGSLYLGWETLCLGRTAARERFESGRYRQRMTVRRGGTWLWNERGEVAGGSAFLGSPLGFAGRTVVATFLAAGRPIGASLVNEVRAVLDAAGMTATTAVTRLPDVFVARYLGDSTEEARAAFVRTWEVLRPALAGRAAVMPRLWST